jgi:hypothetical protein
MHGHLKINYINIYYISAEACQCHCIWHQIHVVNNKAAGDTAESEDYSWPAQAFARWTELRQNACGQQELQYIQRRKSKYKPTYSCTCNFTQDLCILSLIKMKEK